MTGVAADAVTVDALARLQLAARRQRCLIRLRGASDDLRALVAFMGLEDVLSVTVGRARRSGLEPRRQSPQREQPLGGQEERELDDLPVGDLEHLERPRVVAAARVARLVLAEGDRAVGASRRG